MEIALCVTFAVSAGAVGEMNVISACDIGSAWPGWGGKGEWDVVA